MPIRRRYLARSQRSRGWALWCLSALAASACLDDRKLELLESSDAGQAGAAPEHGGAGGDIGGDAGGDAEAGRFSDDGGAGGADAQGGAANAGTTDVSGAGAGGSAEVLSCPDLEGVLDSAEALIKNPAFDAELKTQHWVAGSDREQLWWSDLDAHGQSGSGSLIVQNAIERDEDGSTTAGARQCISTFGGSAYSFAAEVSAPGVFDGYAGLKIAGYGEPDCAGPAQTFGTNVVKGSGWQVISVTYITPAHVQSLGLELIAVKSLRSRPIAVSFDNVVACRVPSTPLEEDDD